MLTDDTAYCAVTGETGLLWQPCWVELVMAYTPLQRLVPLSTSLRDMKLALTLYCSAISIL